MKFLMRVYWLSSFGLIAACGGSVDPALTALESSTGSLNASPDSPTVSLRKAQCGVDGAVFPVATMNYGAAGEQGFQLGCDDPNKPNGLAALVESMGTTWAGYNAMTPENCDTLNQQLSYRSNPPLTCTTGATRQLFSHHDTSDNQLKYAAFLGEQPRRSILRMLGCTELVEALGFDVLEAKPLDPLIYDLFIDMGDDYDLSCKGGTPIVPRRRATCEATNPVDSEFFQNGTVAVNPQTGGFEQGWDVATASWVPPANTCAWRCSPGFVQEGSQCRACRDGEIRLSASSCGPYDRGYFEEVCQNINWVLTNTCRSSDSEIDPSFNPALYAFDNVQDLLVEEDGKLTVAGVLQNRHGIRKGVLRLNSDGTPDLSFAPTFSVPSSGVRAVAKQSNGQYILSSRFSPAGDLLRINQDGSRDFTYQPTVRGLVTDITLQADGKAVIGGVANYGFAIDGVPRNLIARLNTDGRLDTSFNVGGVSRQDGSVRAIEIQDDGKILVGGSFLNFDGLPVPGKGLVRLHSDGRVDTGFSPKFGGWGGYFQVNALALQPNGKILVAGDFQYVNQVPIQGIVRLNPDGSIDTGFRIEKGAHGAVYHMAVNAGTIAISGRFAGVDGFSTKGIARLYADGALDTSFSSDFWPLQADPGSVGIQADGRIVASRLWYLNGAGATISLPLVRLGPQ